MAEEQEVPGTLHGGHALEQRALRFLVEVDDHVTAEDGVEGTLPRPFVHEVQLLEGDEITQLVAGAEPALLAGHRLEEPRHALAAHRLEAVARVHAPLAMSQ